MMFRTICLRCGQPFLTKWHFQKYCGSKTAKLGCSWEVAREQVKQATKKWQKAHRTYSREWKRRLSKEQKERYLETARKYYHNNRERGNILNRERKRRIKSEFVKQLGSQCIICGYNKCIAALDFHHIDRTNKEHKEDWKYKGFQGKIQSGKIQLLCANCHREIENGMEDFSII